MLNTIDKVKAYIRNGRTVKAHNREREKREKRQKIINKALPIAGGVIAGGLTFGVKPTLSLMNTFTTRRVNLRSLSNFKEVGKAILAEDKIARKAFVQDLKNKITYLHDLAKKRATLSKNNISPNERAKAIVSYDPLVAAKNKMQEADDILPKDRKDLQRLVLAAVEEDKKFVRNNRKTRRNRILKEVRQQLDDFIKKYSNVPDDFVDEDDFYYMPGIGGRRGQKIKKVKLPNSLSKKQQARLLSYKYNFLDSLKNQFKEADTYYLPLYAAPIGVGVGSAVASERQSNYDKKYNPAKYKKGRLIAETLYNADNITTRRKKDLK
jgi:hypothetical protein